MVYCVGLTGDIASGKSTVAKLFSKLGIEVFHADKISKELTQKNQPAYNKIVEHYGPEILNNDEELNRKKLRGIIFSGMEERMWLEHLLHPPIRQKLKELVIASTSPYCVVEIPLLITKQAYPYINRILLVIASIETQISRIMQRDQCNKGEALAILSAQPHTNLRLENADDLVINNMELNELEKVVNNLHYKYLRESKNLQ